LFRPLVEGTRRGGKASVAGVGGALATAAALAVDDRARTGLRESLTKLLDRLEMLVGDDGDESDRGLRR
jgi:hypothetical protein